MKTLYATDSESTNPAEAAFLARDAACPPTNIPAQTMFSSDTPMHARSPQPPKSINATPDIRATLMLLTLNTLPNPFYPDLPMTNADIAQSWEALIEHLDQFSTTCDHYINLMKKHNMHLLKTLAQLVQDTNELLMKLDQRSHKLELMPTQLPTSNKLGTLTMMLSQAPNLIKTRVLPCLRPPQPPCTLPHPPHQPALYKISALAPLAPTYLVGLYHPKPIKPKTTTILPRELVYFQPPEKPCYTIPGWDFFVCNRH